MQETWRKLIYPNIPEELNRFEISSNGQLRNVETQHIYKPSLLNTGYFCVKTTLGCRGSSINIIIHKAVAYTFLKNSKNLTEINHIDGNKQNNFVNNLEWCTSHHNQQHKVDIGLWDRNKVSGENNHNAKLTWDEIQYIRDHYVPYSREFGIRSLARKFGVHRSWITDIIQNKAWINR